MNKGKSYLYIKPYIHMKNYLLLISVLALLSGCTNNSEFAQWRGPDRNGIFPETGLLDSWPDEGPELLWVYEGLGRGFASPAVTSNGIYINGEENGSAYLHALDLEGKFRWKSGNGKEFLGEGFSSTYPGARSTPTVDGKHVFTASGRGRIACFKTIDGSEVWETHIVDKLGGELGYFGYSESVAVDKEHVYCFPGGSSTNLAALDRRTGKVAWANAVLRDTFAYGSPVLLEVPGRPLLLHTSRHHVFTCDRNSGELLASYELLGYEYDGEHCNTPVYDGRHIYLVANDIGGQGAMKLELSEDGKEIKEIWTNGQIRNNFGGQLVVDGQVFTTIKGNHLLALASETGRVIDSLNVATGSMVYADSKFIVYGNNGLINLVNYKEGKFEAAGQFKIEAGNGHHFAHPVLSNGIMYIRHGDALMAYRIK